MIGNIKGVVLSARRAFVLERFGVEALERIVASLEPPEREVLEGIILPSGWYPAPVGMHFDAAIVKIMGGESEKALRELGRQSAAQNLAKLHAGYVRGKTPTTFLEQTPAIYRQYYESGRREFQSTGPTSGVLTTYESTTATVADCFTVMGWHEKALEMAGAIDPQVSHPICRAKGGAVCRYEIRWV